MNGITTLSEPRAAPTKRRMVHTVIREDRIGKDVIASGRELFNVTNTDLWDSVVETDRRFGKIHRLQRVLCKTANC